MQKSVKSLVKKDDEKSSVRHNHQDFDAIIHEATQGMPRHKQAFSKFIHQRPVSAVSDVLGKTLMRPNALLFGAISSFFLTLLVYLLSKNLGYSLSGSESMVFFAIGWTAGIVFDIIHHLTNKI